MKALVITVASLIAVTACGSASTAQHAASSPAAVASPGVALNCSLPVGGYVATVAVKGQPDNSLGPDGFPNQKGTGGIIQIPAGTYSPQPASDRAFADGVWLPVLPQAVSPDGRTYAMTQGPSLYVVDVRNRTQRLLKTFSGVAIAQVLAFTSDGIYVQTVVGPGPSITTDLVIVRPDSGTVRPVAGSRAPAGVLEQAWLAISHGAAWGMFLTLKGTAPNQSPEATLVRLDLATGAATNWLESSAPVEIVGFDEAGHPLLPAKLVGPGGLSIVTAPGHVTTLQPQGGEYLAGKPSILSDSHGAWLGSMDGNIWLYTPGGVLEKVATVPAQAGATGRPFDLHAARSVAGPCV